MPVQPERLLNTNEETHTLWEETGSHPESFSLTDADAESQRNSDCAVSLASAPEMTASWPELYSSALSPPSSPTHTHVGPMFKWDMPQT